ncbi:MAG: aspartokinase-like uncharacterized kinase [Pirellulaceae bacterium]|jgi:aspartokinase-like uncharacterized kinase
MTDGPGVRVVKVGGSLLDWDELPTRMNNYLAQDPSVHQILVAGGGGLVDVIRRADQKFQLGEEKAHWLCIDLLSTTARVLHSFVESSAWSESLSDLKIGLAGSPGVWVIDSGKILRRDEPSCTNPLPHGWHVTTDSIAARFAQLLQGELVLLKSSDRPTSSFSDLADLGYVDGHFPEIASQISQVEFVNLRSAE